MNEYRCEMWISHKCLFDVNAENGEEAVKKAKQIVAELKNEGEELTKFTIYPKRYLEGDCR